MRDALFTESSAFLPSAGEVVGTSARLRHKLILLGSSKTRQTNKEKLMRVLVLVLLWVAVAGAQCPVSDAGTCDPGNPQATKSSAKPASTAKGAVQKASKPAAAPQPESVHSGPATPAVEDTITRTQADAILVELKEIHALLKKQQPATPAMDMAKMDFDSFPMVKLASDRRRDNAMGKEDAPITMVEFSDYQCEHCARFHRETFAVIKKKYIETGKLRFVSRDLPLWFHPWAMAAAEASRCAGDQGKYWEMRDALMERSNELSPMVIEQVAQSLLNDMNRYRVCTESRKYYSEIKADVDAAMSAQIPATPGFVIGKSAEGVTEGKRVLGAYPLEQFEKVIDEALSSKP
jgi:protein-disulfide isomerase